MIHILPIYHLDCKCMHHVEHIMEDDIFQTMSSQTLCALDDLLIM